MKLLLLLTLVLMSVFLTSTSYSDEGDIHFLTCPNFSSCSGPGPPPRDCKANALSTWALLKLATDHQCNGGEANCSLNQGDRVHAHVLYLRGGPYGWGLATVTGTVYNDVGTNPWPNTIWNDISVICGLSSCNTGPGH